MPVKQADPALKQQVTVAIQEPPFFKVILLNDDFTTVDFVIEVLEGIFDYSIESAHKITVDIHEQGSAVVAVLPFELAEQKAAETMLLAKANKFPLQARIQPDA